jgi:hexokinase
MKLPEFLDNHHMNVASLSALCTGTFMPQQILLVFISVRDLESASAEKRFLIFYSLTDTFSALGFTFSFPMIQKGLDVGILLTWTKSFNCPSVVGRDAVQMLREALKRRGDTHVEVLAVLNDTAGKFILICE